MAEFNIRSDSVDVEQIMKQIRGRIQEKRGVDYTEEQVRELATVRLEKFLDPKNLRSDLLEQFRRSRPALPDERGPIPTPVEFSDESLFASHRGSLRFVRKLLRPVLKLFFNPNALIQVLHTLNVEMARQRIGFDRSRTEWNALYYEVLHNLVIETTRNNIEVKNLKMRLESLASRLDFAERRVRALEGVVQYRPEVVHQRGSRRSEVAPASDDVAAGVESSLVPTGEGAPQAPGAVTPGEGRRRRRRRRGRRGAGFIPAPGGAGEAPLDADSAGGDEPSMEGDEGGDLSEDAGPESDPNPDSEPQ